MAQGLGVGFGRKDPPSLSLHGFEILTPEVGEAGDGLKATEQFRNGSSVLAAAFTLRSVPDV